MEDVKGELLLFAVAVLGYALNYAKERIGQYLRDDTDFDTKIDNAVLDTEQTGMPGKMKKAGAIEMVKKELKDSGVSLVKRVGLSLFGKLGRSVDRAVFKGKINKIG